MKMEKILPRNMYVVSPSSCSKYFWQYEIFKLNMLLPCMLSPLLPDGVSIS